MISTVFPGETPISCQSCRSRLSPSTAAASSVFVLVRTWCTMVVFMALTRSAAAECSPGSGHGLKYLWGDALSDPLNCLGPQGTPYPSASIARQYRSLWSGSARTARNVMPVDPRTTQQALLRHYANNNDVAASAREGRSSALRDACPSSSPARLCKTRYNTTAPMYGVSLTSGQPVTIVQKFPDLLQQVVFEVCESNECDIVRGECTQTYVPYLFLVIPLGPVTLTGQDYVLVESGCVCRPKSTSPSLSSSASSPPSSHLPLPAL